MAEKLDPQQVVTFEELLRAMMMEQDATRRVLVRKGLLTNEEVLEEIKVVRREMIFGGTGGRSFWLPLWFQSTPANKVSATLVELMQLMARDKLTPPVEAKYSLDEFREAVVHVDRQGRSGKVLLTG